MDEGRKRVLAIVAGILVARHLKTPEDLGESRPSPRTECFDRVRCPMGRSDHDADRWRVRQFTEERKTMTATFEDTLLSVWRQALVEDRKTVTLEGGQYPVRPTSRSKLREVDFRFEEQTLRGLEQNPNTRLALGTTGTRGKEGHAIPKRRPIHRQRGRRQAAILWAPRSCSINKRTEEHHQLKRCAHKATARVRKTVQIAPSWWKRFRLKRVKYSQGSLPRFCHERFACG
jgi:hypothetical protein